MKYFPQKGQLCVYLDPIDGTRYFKDGLKEFNIIATIADDEEIIGVAIFIPAYGLCFKAIRGNGAYLHTERDIQNGMQGKALNMAGNPEILVTYATPDLTEKLQNEFEIIDVASAYVPKRGCLSTNSVLLGQSAAIFSRGASVIDWGAIAFVVKEAGGAVSDFSGAPLPPITALSELRFPELLACRDRTLQQRIIKKFACSPQSVG
jgi:fructose-1,6-bisphosphatase/inositol monophosphatase family enzyme